jgi:hypothetical protein
VTAEWGRLGLGDEYEPRLSSTDGADDLRLSQGSVNDRWGNDPGKRRGTLSVSLEGDGFLGRLSVWEDGLNESINAFVIERIARRRILLDEAR